MQAVETIKGNVISVGIKLVIFSISIFLIVVILFKYYIKNDAQTGLKMNKIIVVSTASGVQNQESDSLWHLNLNQDNDVFIYLEGNEKYAGKELVKKVRIENFSVIKGSNKLNVEIYKDLEEIPIEKIEYDVVEIKPDLGINNISYKGGVIKFKISNRNLGEYISNDEIVISHDGTLLQKAGINLQDIQFSIKFNLIIEDTSGKKYKANIAFDLPYGNILENGVETEELKNVSNAKFERLY